MELKESVYNIYTIGVKDALTYQTNVYLNDLLCIFTFGYNSRLNQRFFNITLDDGTVLLENTFIKLNYEIRPNINFDFLGNYKTRIYFRKKDRNLPLDILSWEENVEIFITTIPPEQKTQELYNEVAFLYYRWGDGIYS